jgi:hypothetical protein
MPCPTQRTHATVPYLSPPPPAAALAASAALSGFTSVSPSSSEEAAEEEAPRTAMKKLRIVRLGVGIFVIENGY